MSKINQIGLIVEDDSDFKALKEIIKRLTARDDIAFKKKIANGCGRMKNKCAAWANELSRRGCDLIILVHDLDRKDIRTLEPSLKGALSVSSHRNSYVCIPVEELEAWFLSCPDAIKTTFSLSRSPKISGLPETITSPKEKIRDYVSHISQNERVYLNTRHNEVLARNIDLDEVARKCPSFEKLNSFMSTQPF